VALVFDGWVGEEKVKEKEQLVILDVLVELRGKKKDTNRGGVPSVDVN